MTLGSPPGEAERREHVRVPLELWVEECDPRAVYFYRGTNLSLGGVFLDGAVPHALGTRLTLRFTLPGDDAALRIAGESVRVGEGPRDLGMAVAFRELEDDGRARLEAFLARRIEAQKKR